MEHGEMKRPHLTESELEDLDLFDELADHLEAKADELAEEIYTSGKDARRSFTARQKTHIYTRDGGKCFYCGEVVTRWHADHVIPHSRGGKTVESNGVVACPSCNLRKSNKVVWSEDEERWTE